MRVLLLADSCNPDWPSLPVVGYNAAKAIADRIDTVLATQVRNRPALSRSGGCGRATVEYLDTEYIAAPIYKLSKILRGGTALNWTTAVASSYPGYIAFEYEAWKRFRSEIESGAFDVIHRLTPMSPTLPSPMATWSPIPFVLGPLNGGLRWPAGFERELRREREYLTYVRSLYKLLPYHRSTYRRAAAILAAFQHTIDDLPAAASDRTIRFPEVGIDPRLFHYAAKEARDRLTFVYVGRLVPYKCPDVALQAFASSAALRRHELVIIGDGPMRAELERTVEVEGLTSCVRLMGWKAQAEVAEIMIRADVLVFPSIRELGAGVVLEAMACGCVPVVVDYGGPAELVTPGSGVKIPLASKAALVERFAKALEDLSEDHARRVTLGESAAKRASTHFTWDARAEKLCEVYEWVTGQRPRCPDFEEPVPAERQ